MKKLLLVVAAIFFLGELATAQNNVLTSAVMYWQGYQKSKDPAELVKARDRIDTAAKHPDTYQKPKTWFYRGEIYYATFVANLLAQKAASKETDDKKKDVEAYSMVSVDELEQAILSYHKCIGLDAKKDFPEAKKKVGQYVGVYSNKGVNLYNFKKFEEAGKYFEKTVELYQTYLATIDTVS